MSISQNFPEEGPTLNLNFAGSKTLDPRITFSRTTTGTYMDDSGLIKVAPADAPRFDHRYVNGEIESLGLLVEESRTNLFPTSEVFVSGWGGAGTTNTDTILNPYGELGTVYYITTSERYRTFNANGYSTLAFSFFSKKRFGGFERDYNDFDIYQVAVAGGALQSYNFRFDGNNPDGTYVKDVKTEQYPNGWYRFSCRLVARSDYNGGIFSTSTRIDLEGSVTDNYIWGIQVEPASFATSYIPTSGSTVARTTDYCRIIGNNFTDFYNQSEGSIRIEYSYNTVGTQNFCPISFDNATNTQTIVLANFAPNGDRWLSSGGVNVGSISYSIGQNLKRSIGYKLNDFGSSVLGNSTVLDNTYTPPLPTQLCIGHAGYFISSRINGHIKNITYYPTRLTNTQLQALTR